MITRSRAGRAADVSDTRIRPDYALIEQQQQLQSDGVGRRCFVHEPCGVIAAAGIRSVVADNLQNGSYPIVVEFDSNKSVTTNVDNIFDRRYIAEKKLRNSGVEPYLVSQYNPRNVETGESLLVKFKASNRLEIKEKDLRQEKRSKDQTTSHLSASVFIDEHGDRVYSAIVLLKESASSCWVSWGVDVHFVSLINTHFIHRAREPILRNWICHPKVRSIFLVDPALNDDDELYERVFKAFLSFASSQMHGWNGNPIYQQKYPHGNYSLLSGLKNNDTDGCRHAAVQRFRKDICVNEVNHASIQRECVRQISVFQSCTQESREEKIFFIHTEDPACTLRLSTAFKVAVDHNWTCTWIQESELLNKIPASGDTFVLDPFEGSIYSYLEEQLFSLQNFTVIGPQCILYILEKNDPGIKDLGYPIYTLGMHNVVVTLTGFKETAEKEEISRLVRRMGGAVLTAFTATTTHIVSNNVLSEKCASAYANMCPVMTVDWILSVWKHSSVSSAHALDAEFLQLECPIFYKLCFCTSQLTWSKKFKIRQIIEKNGGTFSADLVRRNVNVLILENGEGDKYRHARQWGIPCVKPDWIMQSVEAGHVRPLTKYLVKDHGKSSTHADSDKNKLPGITTCSNIRNSLPNVMDRSESTYHYESRLNDSNREIIKKGGTFLDGCKVYLCGSNNNSAEAKIILNSTGAVRLDRVTEKVSHVIVLGPKVPDKDMDMLRHIDPMPFIVGMKWLTESARKGSLADEELFAFQPLEQQSPSSQRSDAPVKTLAQEMERLGITGPLRKSQVRYKQAMDSFDFTVNVELPEVGHNSCAMGEGIFIVEEAGLFVAKRFIVIFEDNSDAERVSGMITAARGKIVKQGEADYFILPPIHSHPELVEYPNFTEHWLTDCIKANKIDIRNELFHKPLLEFPRTTKILDGAVLAFSAYSPQEKLYASSIAHFLGAINQDVFSRKGSPKSGIKASTHLICPFSDTEKFKMAEKWGIPVVKFEWIIDCFHAQKTLSLTPYVVTEELMMEESIMPETPNNVQLVSSVSYAPPIGPPQQNTSIKLSLGSSSDAEFLSTQSENDSIFVPEEDKVVQQMASNTATKTKESMETLSDKDKTFEGCQRLELEQSLGKGKKRDGDFLSDHESFEESKANEKDFESRKKARCTKELEISPSELYTIFGEPAPMDATLVENVDHPRATHNIFQESGMEVDISTPSVAVPFEKLDEVEPVSIDEFGYCMFRHFPEYDGSNIKKLKELTEKKSHVNYCGFCEEYIGKPKTSRHGCKDTRMKTHFINYHKMKQFKCSECECEYVVKTHVIHHIKEMHQAFKRKWLMALRILY